MFNHLVFIVLFALWWNTSLSYHSWISSNATVSTYWYSITTMMSQNCDFWPILLLGISTLSSLIHKLIRCTAICVFVILKNPQFLTCLTKTTSYGSYLSSTLNSKIYIIRSTVNIKSIWVLFINVYLNPLNIPLVITEQFYPYHHKYLFQYKMFKILFESQQKTNQRHFQWQLSVIK